MSPELRKQIASYGCNDTCIFGVVGQHTNGGCGCLGEKNGGNMTHAQKAKIRAGILFMRQEIERLENKLATYENSPGITRRMGCICPTEVSHPCPYKEDVYNDPDTLCNCCNSCAHECAMDI